jgi:hypothetical protein
MQNHISNGESIVFFCHSFTHPPICPFMYPSNYPSIHPHEYDLTPCSFREVIFAEKTKKIEDKKINLVKRKKP